MRLLSSTVRRVLLLAFFCALAGTSTARAMEPTLTADFDGDGRRDCVVRDAADPALLHVWLSSTGSTAMIRHTAPVRRLVARDLDGDRRAELIATDGSVGLRVWTSKRKGFRSFHPRRVVPGALETPRHHRFDDGPTGESPAVTASIIHTIDIDLSVAPRGPTATGVMLIERRTVVSRASQRLAPLAPRPPPAPAI